MSESARGLPFPRGQTWSDYSTATVGAAVNNAVAGKVFEVPDDVHDTGVTIKLIALQNESGGALVVDRSFVGFRATTTLDFLRISDGIAASAGEVCLPIDDFYAEGFSIPEHDYFYVVAEGWCEVETEASAVSLSAGNRLATDASGKINGAVAAVGEFVAGYATYAQTAINTKMTIWIPGVHGQSGPGS